MNSAGQRARDIEALAKKLRGRSDLLFLALKAHTDMVETEARAEKLSDLEGVATSTTEQALLRRDIEVVRVLHSAASDYFESLEAAMDEETRIKLWQQIAPQKWLT